MATPKKTVREERLAQQRDAIASVVTSAGGQTKLAAVLGVTQAAISKWHVRGWMPVHRARECEALFGVDRALLAEPTLVDALRAPAEMFA